mmetsp:Transcript_38376/g.96307  ORF Transcript_38376/g.96307 Transcript_38376/m.96307 type:complete len:251 (-) Transcript_38376:651-1403(-)
MMRPAVAIAAMTLSAAEAAAAAATLPVAVAVPLLLQSLQLVPPQAALVPAQQAAAPGHAAPLLRQQLGAVAVAATQQLPQQWWPQEPKPRSPTVPEWASRQPAVAGGEGPLQMAVVAWREGPRARWMLLHHGDKGSLPPRLPLPPWRPRGQQRPWAAGASAVAAAGCAAFPGQPPPRALRSRAHGAPGAAATPAQLPCLLLLLLLLLGAAVLAHAAVAASLPSPLPPPLLVSEQPSREGGWPEQSALVGT